MVMQFNIQNYKNILKLIQLQNYNFIEACEWKKKSNSKKKIIILRHDIDFDLEYALNIAKIENKLNIKSNFFFLINDEYYNIFSPQSEKILKKILNLDHYIGLHIDPSRYDKINFNKNIKRDIKYFENFYNLKINSYSFHKPTIYNFSQIKINFAYHSYNKKLLKEYKYISDSSMVFDYKLLNNLVTQGEKIHLLIHPLWWTTNSNKIDSKLNEVINKKIESLNYIFYNYKTLLKSININKSKKKFLYHLKSMK